MFFNLINLVKGLLFFTGSYSNNVFLEPLTPEEEDKYVKLMLEGNTSARNKLIEHNLRLVAHIVKKYTNNNNNDMTDDLISIGTIGLIKGIDTYKNNKKTKITTYAARCIQNATFTSKNFLTELMTYLKELVHNYNFLIR